MRITITGVGIETVRKPGGKGYKKATVSYLFNGQSRQQSVMDFSNPAVFAKVEQLTPNQEIDVEVGKNDQGYNEWKSVATGPEVSAGTQVLGQATGTGTNKVVGSNYETREERANRQVLIVKQSSINAAVASLTPGAKAPLDPDEVIKRAQFYTDFVFSNEEISNDE